MKYLIIIVCTLFLSCTGGGEKPGTAQISESTGSGSSAVNNDSLFIKIRFLRNLPVKTLPFRDSTNFDQFKFSALLTQEQQWRYGLGNMVSPYHLEDIRFSEMRYRLSLSDQFVSVVFTTQVGEHELRTDLANFDNNFRLIDFKTIAYDEIAEGCLQKTSMISQEKIIIYEANYCDEDTSVLEKPFMVDHSGMIKPLQ